MSTLPDVTQPENRLYRLILDNALDAFIAVDESSNIIEWSLQAEHTFGWTREEVLGRPLTDTIVPVRYHAAHFVGLKRFLRTGEHVILNKRVELCARRKDGSELPVELTVAVIDAGGRKIFSASMRDISQRKALEEVVRHQANITRSILDSMADAVAVADLSERLIMANPAAQRLLDLRPVDDAGSQSVDSFSLYQSDKETLCPHGERPLIRALRGERVDGAVAFIRHGQVPGGAWASINARPLLDRDGQTIGAVAVFHDITSLHEREEALARQALQLEEQASLLELAQDAIIVRTPDDVIAYWNRGAEELYGYRRDEAIGKACQRLLSTTSPVPLDAIRAIVDEKHYWEGELTQVARDGREIIVFSRWTTDRREGRPARYLETNTDITKRIKAERALKQAQEDFRLLVEASTDYAMMMIDPSGRILSWNAGAEHILGMSEEEAVGQPIDNLFTAEDRELGAPRREMEEARANGRSEDNRWHVRPDGSRFWATGVVTPVWNEDGSLRSFVKIMRDQTAKRLADEETQFLANHDMLTGLPNRVHLSSRLHKFLAQAQRNDTTVTLLLLDLDKFKYVNDTFGHHVGDLLLKEVAERILSTLRETDFVARLGGDEFVVVQTDGMQPAAGETLASKLIRELGRIYRLDGQDIISGTSIGISTYPTDAKNSVELLKKADLALYRAKSRGRGTHWVYTSELSTEQATRESREQALRNALKNRQFELYYQPQVDLHSWKITNVEALLRWQQTDVDLVTAGEFLELAEQTGIIVELGEWALREACGKVSRWQTLGLKDLRLSVNCSARQFSDPGFVGMIEPILNDTGLAADCLELEVNESMLAGHPGIRQQLSDLRALGVRIAIDNFGTGATPLVDLKELDIDVLKIDKAFIRHLPHRRRDSAIASAIITLAHDLGIGVAAGGVETAEQLAYLKARDCTSAQGFIFSPPLPAEKFEQLMMSGHWSRINGLPGAEDEGGGRELH